MCNYETNKGGKTSSTHDKEKNKKEETVHVHDGTFSIYECGKNVCQSTYELVCTPLDYIRYVSINIETRCQDLSLFIKNYAQDLQNLRNRYQHLETNNMHFDCANITNITVSNSTKEYKSGT